MTASLAKRVRFLPWLCCLMLLASCAPPPKPPAVLVLNMAGGADQNPSSSGAAAPIAVRLYQLTATAKFERGDVFALTDREKATLGEDDAGSQEFVLAPGEKRKLEIELKPMVQFVGVVALFRDIDNAKWRAMAQVATSGPTNLTLTVEKLAVTLKPTP